MCTNYLDNGVVEDSWEAPSISQLVLQTASFYTWLTVRAGQNPIQVKSTVFILLFAPKPPSSCEYLEPYQPQIIS
jgi:hypothetical protein